MFLIDRIRNSGIVARLSASFIAVTALAVAANFLADHAANTETTRVERVVATVPVAVPVAPVAEAPAAAKPEALPVGAAIEVLKSLELMHQSALARTAGAEPDASTALAQAKDRLAQSARALDRQVRTADGNAPARLLEHATGIGLTADQLAACADQRRLAFSEYRRHLIALDEHLKGALDSSFKILGRFIARQYLLQLSTGLEAVRKRYDEALASDAASDKLTALATAEHDLAGMLRDNAASLQRVQGQPWLDFMNTELGVLAQHRGTLQQLHQDYAAARTRLLEQKIELAVQVERSLNALHLRGASAVKPLPVDSPPKTVTAPAPAPLSAAADVAPPDASTETVTVMPRDTSRDRLIAGITLAVIGCVFLVSLFTVLSIVRPVRRLLRAAARLAQGDLTVRVPAGGLKELDHLGRSFNVMAEGLAQADDAHRSYQTRLEQEVATRTLELKELAERDPLTSLANRRVWQTLMEAALASAREQGLEIGVFFIDLDNFKNINDSLGHSYGDRVLMLIADRLTAVSGGFGFAARVGGDEFCVVCTDAGAAGSLAHAGASLVEAFREPLHIEQRELIVSVSIGMSVFPAHGQTSTELLSAADAALFRAKALGRNQLNVYTPELLASANERFGLEQRLRRAIERQELVLVFQPEVAVDSLQVVMVEALLRWRQPDGRLATPGEFLAVAEASGVMAEFDAWVLEQAIATASQWHHGEWPQARVAINVSPRQLAEPAFADRILSLLERYRLPPRSIEIELTETALQTGSAVVDTLHRLRELGVPVALDDFGTGYSSLTSLEQLPLSRVKLDRSLLTGLGRLERSEAIVHTIVTLCQHLNLEVTAEGIESAEQFGWLLQYKHLCLQGFLLSRPLDESRVLPALSAVAQHVIYNVLAHVPQTTPVAAVDSPVAAVS